MRLILLSLLLFPSALQADPPRLPPDADLGPTLTADEFDHYATGKTLVYAEDGMIWGSEQYLPDRQVLWAFTDQPCEYGTWYADRGAICFIYEGRTVANCWYFYHGASGLVARFIGGGGLLSEVGRSSEPMNCPGPQVGA